MNRETKNQPPQFRVYVNDGNGGSHDIVNLSEVTSILKAHFTKITSLGPETGISLRVLKIKYR